MHRFSRTREAALALLLALVALARPAPAAIIPSIPIASLRFM